MPMSVSLNHRPSCWSIPASIPAIWRPRLFARCNSAKWIRQPWNCACAVPRSRNLRSSIPCAATMMTALRIGVTTTSTMATTKATDGWKVPHHCLLNWVISYLGYLLLKNSILLYSCGHCGSIGCDIKGNTNVYAYIFTSSTPYF